MVQLVSFLRLHGIQCVFFWEDFLSYVYRSSELVSVSMFVCLTFSDGIFDSLTSKIVQIRFLLLVTRQRAVVELTDSVDWKVGFLD